jgi:hypothetical protein
MSTQPSTQPRAPSSPPPVATPRAAAQTPIGGIPAYGTLIQVLSSGSGVTPEVYTTIEGVGDLAGPTNAMAEVDVTSHSTGVPIKQTIPGLIDLGDLSFPCYWIPSDPTQNISSPFGLEYLFMNRVITKWQLVNPDPTHRTRQFHGFVKTLTEDSKVAGVMTRTVAIRITTPLTDVASAIAITPTSSSPAAAGAPTTTFNLTTGGSNAPWQPIPDQTWVTITTPVGLQQGDGVVTFAVAVNTTGTARTAHINIAAFSLVYTVNQLAT